MAAEDDHTWLHKEHHAQFLESQRYCRFPGCEVLAERKFCPKHQYLPTREYRYSGGRFKVTIDFYDTLSRLQDDVCAICGNKETMSDRKRMAVDHCHETGNIRGLLCGKCNAGIGWFNDNARRLRAAAAYLERPPYLANPHRAVPDDIPPPSFGDPVGEAVVTAADRGESVQAWCPSTARWWQPPEGWYQPPEGWESEITFAEDEDVCTTDSPTL